MSLRRKLALWLYPSMPGEIAMMASIKATEAHIDAINNTNYRAASKREEAEAAWKADVLEQLRALNANLASVTENGSAMKVVNT